MVNTLVCIPANEEKLKNKAQTDEKAELTFDHSRTSVFNVSEHFELVFNAVI